MSIARHGDCIGADTEFHDLVTSMGFKTIIHPPTNPQRRAYCKGDVILKEKPYIVRDHLMVDAVDFLLACPYTNDEVLRSGTWATIRYARKTEVPYFIIPRTLKLNNVFFT